MLQGPQGGGSGRNASAGAIRIVSRRPGDELEATLRSSIGNYNLRDFEGAIQAPLVEDQLSSRLAFRFTERDPILDQPLQSIPSAATAGQPTGAAVHPERLGGAGARRAAPAVARLAPRRGDHHARPREPLHLEPGLVLRRADLQAVPASAAPGLPVRTQPLRAAWRSRRQGERHRQLVRARHRALPAARHRHGLALQRARQPSRCGVDARAGVRHLPEPLRRSHLASVSRSRRRGGRELAARSGSQRDAISTPRWRSISPRSATGIPGRATTTAPATPPWTRGAATRAATGTSRTSRSPASPATTSTIATATRIRTSPRTCSSSPRCRRRRLAGHAGVQGERRAQRASAALGGGRLHVDREPQRLPKQFFRGAGTALNPDRIDLDYKQGSTAGPASPASPGTSLTDFTLEAGARYNWERKTFDVNLIQVTIAVPPTSSQLQPRPGSRRPARSR